MRMIISALSLLLYMVGLFVGYGLVLYMVYIGYGVRRCI